jgi:catechol 2,3-dioxygenase-like lactoylglutathione lyase family enzyme
MPKLDGVLETALYTDDIERARAFYEDVLGLKPLFTDARLRAYGVASRSVLLIFKRGAATQTVTIPGGTIPGHDGAGPLHVAFAIGKDELAHWEKHLAARGVAGRPQHLLPRSGRPPPGACDAGIVDGVLRAG